MIAQFIKRCSEHKTIEVCNFGTYFKDNYASRPEEWALGLRGLYVSTTTMSLEAFHHLLKYNAKFMNGKVNRRLDSLLKHLYSYMANMKQRELVVTAAKRVVDKTSSLNFKNHKEAFTQSFSLVSNIDCGGWRVQSFSVPGITYEVKRTDYNCNNDPCLKACWDCGVCFHEYTCTCPRVAEAHGRITCKHSHLLTM